MLRRILLAALLLTASTAFADKTLDWPSLGVVAHLEQNGTVHVVETQVMRFTGDWNGGERTFHLRTAETLHFNRMARLAADGRLIPMVEGDVDSIDHYKFTDTNTLRWRSRLPSDPPFDHTEITYVLDYTIENVVRVVSGERSSPKDGRYLLDEDFAFPYRLGVIEHFSLDLTFDPAWQPVSATPRRYSKDNLPPGEGYVLQIPLRYIGASIPLSVPFAAPRAIRYGALALLLGGILILFANFVRGERAVGRLVPLIDDSTIDEAWLQQNVFSTAPEVVGAAWDEKTGAAEVAAVLARMAQEGKLESNVEKGGFFRSDVLHLKLKVDEASLPSGERALIQSLFLGERETDTAKIREHYKSSGFDPSSKIKSPIQRALRGLKPWRDRQFGIRWRWRIAALVASVVLLGVAAFSGQMDVVAVLFTGFTGVFVLIFGSILAYVLSSRITGLAFFWPLMVAPELPLVALVAVAALGVAWVQVSGLTLFALVAYALSIFAIVTEAGKIKESADKIAFRKTLAAARRHFQNQLRLRDPQLKDSWFPYLLAFGLGSHIDRWFRSYGVSTGSSFGPASSTSSFGSGSSSSSGWTGGGGSFGGAGASGSWAVAAGSLAAGVSAPSSGGGGGGGGGGGSSGGGGGGGW